MEDDPVFDAGTGSCLTADGTVEMDAVVMDGATLKTGAVVSSRAVRLQSIYMRSFLASDATVLLGRERERRAGKERQEGLEMGSYWNVSLRCVCAPCVPRAVAVGVDLGGFSFAPGGDP